MAQELSQDILNLFNGDCCANEQNNATINPDPNTLVLRTAQGTVRGNNAINLLDLVTLQQLNQFVPSSIIGNPNGVAPLNGAGQIDPQFLPSYVDDVLEFPTTSFFPAIGEEGKIYIATSNNLTYRWTGSIYVEVSPSNPLTILQGGNTFGVPMVIGTNDVQSFSVKIGNTPRFTLSNANFTFNTNGRIANSLILGTIGTDPTHTLTFHQTGTGIAQYNTADQITNFERLRQYWNNNTFIMSTEAGGTGLPRPVQISGIGRNLTVGGNTSTGMLNFAANTGTTNTQWFGITGILSASTGSQQSLALINTINQSGTAGYRGLWISPYEQGTGSGSKLLIDVGTNSAANGSGTHTSVFNVDNLGKLNIKTQVFENNTEATTAGLNVGDVYRTATGVLMIRF